MDIVKVTSIDELKVMSQGELVELPPFIAGQKFVARLRRPSMMGLIQKGKIPNNLLRAANSLFTNKVEEEADLDDAFLKDVLFYNLLKNNKMIFNSRVATLLYFVIF